MIRLLVWIDGNRPLASQFGTVSHVVAPNYGPGTPVVARDLGGEFEYEGTVTSIHRGRGDGDRYVVNLDLAPASLRYNDPPLPKYPEDKPGNGGSANAG